MSRWDKHRIVVDLDRFTVCTQLNIILDRDLAANRPDPVIHTILTEQTVQVGHMAWLLKLQSKMLGDAYLLQCFPGTVTI